MLLLYIKKNKIGKKIWQMIYNYYLYE